MWWQKVQVIDNGDWRFWNLQSAISLSILQTVSQETWQKYQGQWDLSKFHICITKGIMTSSVMLMSDIFWVICWRTCQVHSIYKYNLSSNLDPHNCSHISNIYLKNKSGWFLFAMSLCPCLGLSVAINLKIVLYFFCSAFCELFCEPQNSSRALF
jgi:hypothetical protein